MLDSKANELMFLGHKEELKGYKLWDPKNKEFVLSRHGILDKILIVKPTVSQQKETMKTKLVLSSRWRVMLLHIIQLVQHRLGFHRS